MEEERTEVISQLDSRGTNEFPATIEERKKGENIRLEMARALAGFGEIDDCYRLAIGAETPEAKNVCIEQLLQIDNPILSQEFIKQMEQEGWGWLLDHDLKGYATPLVLSLQAAKIAVSKKREGELAAVAISKATTVASKKREGELADAAVHSLKNLTLQFFVKFWPTYKSIMEGIFRGKLLADSAEGFEASKANYPFKASEVVAEVVNYVEWLKGKNADLGDKIEIQDEISSEQAGGRTVEIVGYRGLIVNSILNKIRNSARDIVAATKIIFRIYIDKDTNECVFEVKDDGTGMAEGRLDYKNRKMFAYGPASGSGSTGSGLNGLPEAAAAVGASVECITRTRDHNPEEWTRFISVPDNSGKPIYKDADINYEYPGGNTNTGTIMRLRFPVAKKKK